MEADASPVDSHAEIYLVSGVDTDAPVFQPRGDALFNVSDDVLQGAENDITWAVCRPYSGAHDDARTYPHGDLHADTDNGSAVLRADQ